MGAPGSSDLEFLDSSAKAGRQIATAWESFVSGGTIVGARPRPVIFRGWQRCRKLGINAGSSRAPTQVSAEEIETILGREALGVAGLEVLRHYEHLVDGSGHVIVLADARGRILLSVGRKGTQQRLERINFMPGGIWAEDVVGPNGIGTPIAIGRPELVFGSEHFCQGWQPWVCYGSPIRHPDSGEIIGAVDITGAVRGAQPEILALTIAIAQMVEQRMQVGELLRRDLLRSRFRDLERRWPEDGLVLLSAQGRVLDANDAALGRLCRGSDAVLGRPMRELNPDLWSVLRSCPAGREAEWEVGAQAQATPVRVRVEPIWHGSERLGLALIIKKKSAIPEGGRRGAQGRVGGHGAAYGFTDLIGESPAFRDAVALARLAARDPSENPVLLTGESGTGKELIAHAIHGASRRAAGPMVVINCGALPATLAESDLFGYAPGAFTGAHRHGHAGKFETAHGGTLFIDEVDSLPLELQVKFLRALEEGRITRLGSTTPVNVDVRVVAAASARLRDQLACGAFRTDLFHRLAVIEIDLPPLRERGGDLPLLIHHLLGKACSGAGRGVPALSAEVMSRLQAYAWPGNVRELRNLCSRWALMAAGEEIALNDLPAHLRMPLSTPVAGTVHTVAEQGLHEIKDALIRQALQEAGGCISRAASRLGINRTTVYRRMKRWERH